MGVAVLVKRRKETKMESEEEREDECLLPLSFNGRLCAEIGKESMN